MKTLTTLLAVATLCLTAGCASNLGVNASGSAGGVNGGVSIGVNGSAR